MANKKPLPFPCNKQVYQFQFHGFAYRGILFLQPILDSHALKGTLTRKTQTKLIYIQHIFLIVFYHLTAMACMEMNHFTQLFKHSFKQLALLVSNLKIFKKAKWIFLSVLVSDKVFHVSPGTISKHMWFSFHEYTMHKRSNLCITRYTINSKLAQETKQKNITHSTMQFETRLCLTCPEF